MSAKHDTHSEGPSGVEAIARWTRSIDTNDVPSACITQAKLLLLDSIGCAIAGAEEPACKGILAVAEETGGTGPCTIIGRTGALDMPHAVLANGALLRVLDLSDYVVGKGKNGPEIGGHPSDNIPVALAAGEARRRSGLDMLAAIAVGYELFGRLKNMMDRKGPWDGVSLSAFVASAMAGRLMDLDTDRLMHALALSGTRAATPALVRHGGISAAKSISNALVAQSAVEATLLAEQGITGPLRILEHPRGLRDLFPNGDIHTVMAPPYPTDSYILAANVKTYPCLATGQAAVAAGLALHAALRGKLDAIERIEIAMGDYSFVREQQEDPGRVRPQSREAADHSFQFLVAVSLVDGAFGTAQFASERWFDPQIVALMAKMVTSQDATLNARAPTTYPCLLRVHLRDGNEHVAEILFPPGYSQGGLSESDVVAKFQSISDRLPQTVRDRIVASVLGLDRSPNADGLAAVLRF